MLGRKVPSVQLFREMYRVLKTLLFSKIKG